MPTPSHSACVSIGALFIKTPDVGSAVGEAEDDFVVAGDDAAPSCVIAWSFVSLPTRTVTSFCSGVATWYSRAVALMLDLSARAV